MFLQMKTGGREEWKGGGKWSVGGFHESTRTAENVKLFPYPHVVRHG